MKLWLSARLTLSFMYQFLLWLNLNLKHLLITWNSQFIWSLGFFYPPSSEIAPCVGTAGTVMWCLHLKRPCCVAIGWVLFTVYIFLTVIIWRSTVRYCLTTRWHRVVKISEGCTQVLLHCYDFTSSVRRRIKNDP